MEKSRRSRAHIDYALLVNGKGVLESKLASTKLKKSGPLNKDELNKKRKSVPVLTSVQSEQREQEQKRNVEGNGDNAGGRLDGNSVSTVISVSPAATKTRKIRNMKDRDQSLSNEQAFSSFPLLPTSLTGTIVNFSIPQEMIEECNYRRKEAEDESVAFLFEAVRTLHDRDPLIFRQKYAVLNHLFEETPKRISLQNSGENITCKNEETQCRSGNSATEVVIGKNGNFEVVSTLPEVSNCSNIMSSQTAVEEIAVESLANEVKNEVGVVSKGTKTVCSAEKSRPVSGRPRGRPKRSLKQVLTSLSDAHQLDSDSTENINSDQVLDNKLLHKEKSERPVRRRTTSGFYRALNSMALTKDYQFKRTNKGFPLLY